MYRLALILLLTTWSLPAFSPPAPPLTRTIDRLLNLPSVRSAFWGVYVKDLMTGEVIYERNGDKRFIPASNLKLFTTATALDALGSEYRYQTVLYFKGTVRDDALVGDLVIRGSGDPTFGSSIFERDPLYEWAQELRRLGVRRIEGRLIGDDNVFDDQPFQEGWDVNLAGRKTYATATSGLSFANNVDNRQPVIDATRFTLSAFELRLRTAGIQTEVELLDIDDLGRYNYRGSRPLLAYLSPPMHQIIRLINKTSNNFYAEHLFRTISRNGTARGGADRVQALLTEAGVPRYEVSIRDGSGLSRKDMITPRSMVELLAYMNRHPEWRMFTRSIPAGGERGTTLSDRLKGVPVQAKTGSLEFSRALSGYVTSRNGSVLAFSIIANNYASRSGAVSDTIDALVRALAAYDGS